MKYQPKKHTHTILFTALTSLSANSMAQMVLEEVVVTAFKRESNLMSTAAAVSSYDQNTRNELGIDSGADIARHTPSLTLAPSRVSIRGVGRSTVALGSDPGVGIYVDGVYTTETDIFGYANFLDIERVEVLRGPQGTLYGRNSIGGAVNFISTKPDTDEWGGKAVVEAGNYDYLVLQGLTDGPVTEKLSALVALSTITREGYQDNEGSSKRFDEQDSVYGTIHLQHDTTDSWTNALKVFRAKSDRRGAQPYVLNAWSTDFIQRTTYASDGRNANFPGMFPAQNFVNGQQGATRQNPALSDENNIAIDFEPYVDSERSSATFISEYDFNEFTLKYTGGYSEFEYQSDFDADGMKASESRLDWGQLGGFLGGTVEDETGFGLTPAMTTRPFTQKNDSYSHELQLITDFDGDFNFIGGLYYYNSDEVQTLQFVEGNDELMATYRYFGLLGGLPASDENYLFNGRSELETNAYAAYGQMDWDVTNSTMLNVGLRYSYDKKEGSDRTFVQFVGDPGERNAADDWNQVTWRIGLDHNLSDNHFVYGFIATGYRSGGFNLMAPNETTAVNTVEPEELISYEIGYKGTMLDDRLNLSTSLFYYDYTDLQVQKQELINGVATPVFENASDATAWGVEAELMALVTDNLIVSGNYSYNNTEYKDYDSVDTVACALGPLQQGNDLAPICTDVQDLSGNEFLLSPEHKASANLTYMWELADLDYRATVSYQYVGEQFTNAFNNDDFDKLDGYGQWDARLSVLSQEDIWELTAYVKNISDDREAIYNERPSTVSTLQSQALTNPRMYGVRLTYNF
ncbi:MAG: iron complex outermembrane receptor protein [Halioglobus sp.]|jgi:iron complex outermembrane receptor protein